MAGIKESLTKGIATLNMKTNTFMEESKYKTYINNLENEIRQMEQNLGHSIYMKWNSGADWKDGVEQVLSDIKSKQEEIAAQHAAIEKLHQEEQAILGTGTQQQENAPAEFVFCGQCGTQNAANYRFCAKCGNPLH